MTHRSICCSRPCLIPTQQLAQHSSSAAQTQTGLKRLSGCRQRVVPNVDAASTQATDDLVEVVVMRDGHGHDQRALARQFGLSEGRKHSRAPLREILEIVAGLARGAILCIAIPMSSGSLTMVSAQPALKLMRDQRLPGSRRRR